MRWRGLELPTKVTLDEDISTDSYGLLVIEPFERGFGTTVGNSLRRILLSSLEGSAVTSINIEGVEHEFSSVPGVLEDVTDIVLNIKSLVVSLDSDVPKTMTVSSDKVGVVTAADIKADTAITVINPEQVIATLTEKISFKMEMTVARGRGYVPASEDPNAESYGIGVIPVDALYSPVVRVRYKTEETRVGQSINYDRLLMEIWTDSTVSPEMALVESAKILRKHLGPFIQYFDLGEAVAPDPLDDEEEIEGEIDEELQRKLAMPVQELELSVRAGNCLELAQIDTVGKLVSMEESKLLTLRSFGKTSLREIKRKLTDLGLELGLGVDEGASESETELQE
jgi:DNA-directed RNA polymerase subunit alpha